MNANSGCKYQNLSFQNIFLHSFGAHMCFSGGSFTMCNTGFLISKFLILKSFFDIPWVQIKSVLMGSHNPSDWKLNFEFEFPEDRPNKFGIK